MKSGLSFCFPSASFESSKFGTVVLVCAALWRKVSLSFSLMLVSAVVSSGEFIFLAQLLLSLNSYSREVEAPSDELGRNLCDVHQTI